MVRLLLNLEGVDFTFLEREEGKRILTGYVPTKNGQVIGKSGVTIATGIDLGQRTVQQITRTNLPEDLKLKLLPYLGKRQNEAINELRRKPLLITEGEAKALDDEILKGDIGRMICIYDLHSHQPFELIPNQAKTVLASLAINFGPNIYKILPNTWRFAVTGDWKGLARRLENFPSKQPELEARRKREAALLTTIWA